MVTLLLLSFFGFIQLCKIYSTRLRACLQTPLKVVTPVTHSSPRLCNHGKNFGVYRTTLPTLRLWPCISYRFRWSVKKGSRKSPHTEDAWCPSSVLSSRTSSGKCPLVHKQYTAFQRLAVSDPVPSLRLFLEQFILCIPGMVYYFPNLVPSRLSLSDPEVPKVGSAYIPPLSHPQSRRRERMVYGHLIG